MEKNNSSYLTQDYCEEHNYIQKKKSVLAVIIMKGEKALRERLVDLSTIRVWVRVKDRS